MECGIMRAIALTSLVMIGSAQAQQVPDTIFGLELNAPLSIPECQLDKKSRTYFPAEGSCYTRDQVRDKKGRLTDAKGPLSDDRIEIYFAHKSRPEIVSALTAYGVLRAGNLAVVGTRTGGIATQARDLAQLQGKYGTPKRLESLSLQNGMGAKYEGLVAEWELPTGIHVRLESPDMSMAKLPGVGGINIGTLSVSNAVIQAEQEARRNAEDSQRTRL